jgi:hypothetical protein
MLGRASASRGIVVIALAIMAGALCSAGPAVAGQIVFQRQVGGSTNLWVMNDDGSDPRSLIADNQYQGITGAGQPNLRPGSTDLAFTGSGSVATGSNSCGINCRGVYTLIGGNLVRASPAVEPCTGSGDCSSEVDNDPTLTADGRVVYLHSGSYTGTACYFYYCQPYGDIADVFLVQSDVGGDTPVAGRLQGAVETLSRRINSPTPWRTRPTPT